ncbi:hypothetical protein AB0K08_09865 [Citricoccus sp. NPDC055426]|uniref:hypothetical protein n=1 Tax=Citricoccus sp. NPDC055426 TaxID=3155536 RepID=UPI00341C0267
MATPNAPMDNFSWLPQELESVALRLARADECSFDIGAVASKWSSDGPLGFEQVRRGDEVQTFLKSVKPVPPVVALLFSEAVNHLRAAIDNVIWYLVEREHGQLSGFKATLVNMPIHESLEAFDKWTKRRVKEEITVFGPDAPLGRRLRILQPYVDLQSDVPSMSETLAAIVGHKVEYAQPLRLLQAYSNEDKHRAIRVAAARTFSSTDRIPLAEQNLYHQELKVGDPMGPPAPWGQVSILETNTALMIERPAPFAAWVNPVNDLSAMRRHVSQVVVPVLLTGLQMPNGLPPQIDLGDSGLSNRERLTAASWDDAHTRLMSVVWERYHEAMSRGVQFTPVVECTDADEEPQDGTS